MVQKRIVPTLKQKYRSLRKELDERGRRLWAATESQVLGHGGITAVSRATGLSISTIRRGVEELGQSPPPSGAERRVRRTGGGRKPLLEHDPDLLQALDDLVEPTTRGDPESPLRWTCKSTRRLAEELTRHGHRISHMKVAKLLGNLGYSLQSSRKTQEGNQHPDRDAQFEYIHQQGVAHQRRQQPVVSVDTKKKELVGNYKNGGQEWQLQGKPEAVSVHDFMDKELGKAIPYGIYDVRENCGWVSVGVDHDTAAFAVQTLRRWWDQMGRKTYPRAQELLVIADGGGSNSSRCRQWKLELQRFADDSGLVIRVCHLPPGTSKWNKIEHRLFSQITENWRGRPLVSHEAIVNLIANTTTKTGLYVRAELDPGEYPTGVVVTDEQMKSLNLEPAGFHGHDWNYALRPHSQI